jgi:carbamoyl-phosphate synthase large subunit
MAASVDEAREVAQKIGYPVLVRPSYVLGGRAMAIVLRRSTLESYVRNAVGFTPDRPVLIDKFLEQSSRVRRRRVADDTACVIAGIQEHIEEAGIHSGDSSCVLPPVRIDPEHWKLCALHARSRGAVLCRD